MDLGYLRFMPGDLLYEHFYSDRWYNVYEVRSEHGQLKGWYCNVTRPALFVDGSIESEDLELDLFVAPDRRTILVLDEDEFAARQLEATDPAAHRAALAALGELRELVAAGQGPFAPRERMG
jgi:protein associated with RNAse G/E